MCLTHSSNNSEGKGNEFHRDICFLFKPFQTPPETILFSEVEPFFERLHNNKQCVYRVSFLYHHIKELYFILMYKMDPYWTYEFCPGTHIRQYHEAIVVGKVRQTPSFSLSLSKPCLSRRQLCKSISSVIMTLNTKI